MVVQQNVRETEREHGQENGKNNSSFANTYYLILNVVKEVEPNKNQQEKEEKKKKKTVSLFTIFVNFI